MTLTLPTVTYRGMLFTEADLSALAVIHSLLILTAKLSGSIDSHNSVCSGTNTVTISAILDDTMYCDLSGRGEYINCIKRVRELTGWGLRDSKNFVETHDQNFSDRRIQ